ncbi:DUF2778 domain-containing protein [Allorhizobium taibaishanense]|uniref:Tlde1 domain-containing protein n=2 Tax=Allorhizobium taibaishanense TaxID=887144 RepID=A0A1Q9A163_9HYPH|nr:DUF2778 domain-containing protein [Allorhizobium taibaishanense]OLP48274.1 hypothetical protein BJF91_09075 [Allorhizobium taibaishanense]
MPASCSFKLNGQSTSALICNGFGSVPAFSGMTPHKDDPGAVGLANVGPLPQGRYYIIDRQRGGRLGPLREWIQDAVTGVDRSEWFTLYRVDDVIDDYTFVNGVKRGNFRLHPNGRFGISEGCITVLSLENFERLRDFLLKQSSGFISGTTIKYYGTVDVQ